MTLLDRLSPPWLHSTTTIGSLKSDQWLERDHILFLFLPPALGTAPGVYWRFSKCLLNEWGTGCINVPMHLTVLMEALLCWQTSFLLFRMRFWNEGMDFSGNSESTLCEITTKAVSLESLKPPIYPSVNAFTYLSNVVERDWNFVRHCR